MYTRITSNYALISALTDMLFTVFTLYISGAIRLLAWVPFVPLESHIFPFWLYPVVCIIWITVFCFNSVYDLSGPSIFNEEAKLLSYSVSIAALILAGVLYLTHRELSRGFFLIFALSNLLFLLGWRVLVRSWMQRRVAMLDAQKNIYDVRKRILIVGAGELGQKIAQTLRVSDKHSVRVVGYADDQSKSAEDLPILGMLKDVRTLISEERIHDVIIALPMQAYASVVALVKDLEESPVHIRVIPDYFHLAVYKTQIQDFDGIPLVNLRAPALSNIQRMFKRMFDIVFASTVLLCVSPLMLLISLCIKLESKGPIFFMQQRIGENGSTFNMIKFRSMIVNAEELQESVNTQNERGELIHKQKNDPRITKVGRWIRVSSMDELPQLINVLAGHMSLVGPRPELPWLVSKYQKGQRTRFAVPQGITGWWQINGRSDKPMHLNMEDDMYYINHYSFWLDLYILLKTPLVVIKGKGAY